MLEEGDIITTEVEVITYVEEADGLYKNIKVEAASPVSSIESQNVGIPLSHSVYKKKLIYVAECKFV